MIYLRCLSTTWQPARGLPAMGTTILHSLLRRLMALNNYWFLDMENVAVTGTGKVFLTMSSRPLPLTFKFKTTLFIWCQQATVSNLNERSVSNSLFGLFFFKDKRLARNLVRLMYSTCS